VPNFESNVVDDQPTDTIHLGSERAAGERSMKRKNKLAKVRVPKRLKGYVTREELALIREVEAMDGIVPEPEPEPEPLYSEKFDLLAACKAFQCADDPEHRGRLLLSEVAATLTGANPVDVAASLMRSLKPRNGLEALLLTQMSQVHIFGTHELTRAASAQDHLACDMHTNRACKLFRVFVGQIEALQGLRSKGKLQKVIVKHVHVNVAGQAVVGVHQGGA
jgi:hypothetical protein